MRDVISLVTLPVGFIFVLLVSKVTLLFHFVVVDVEGLTVDVVGSVLARGGCVRSLEANESVRHLTILLLEKFE